MIKQYRPILAPVQAVQFVYSTDGINALDKLCGKYLLVTQKARSPTAIGEACISLSRTNGGKVTWIKEGSWITMNIHGELATYSAEEFRGLFVEII